MPRWDKFFAGMAQGIPQGYQMGLAYQEEQRAKAEEGRRAEMHPGALKAQQQGLDIGEQNLQKLEDENYVLAHTQKARIEDANLQPKVTQTGIAATEQNIAASKGTERRANQKRGEERKDWLGKKAGEKGQNLAAINLAGFNTPPQANLDNLPDDIRPIYEGEDRIKLQAAMENYAEMVRNDAPPEDVAAARATVLEMQGMIFDDASNALNLAASTLARIPKQGWTAEHRRAVELQVERLTAGFADQGIAFDATVRPENGTVEIRQYDLNRWVNDRPVSKVFSVSMEDLAEGDIIEDWKAKFVERVSGTTKQAEQAEAELKGRKARADVIKAENDAMGVGMPDASDVRADDAALTKAFQETPVLNDKFIALTPAQREYIWKTNSALNRAPSWAAKSPNLKAAVLVKAASRPGWAPGVRPDGSVYLRDPQGRQHNVEQLPL